MASGALCSCIRNHVRHEIDRENDEVFQDNQFAISECLETTELLHGVHSYP